VAALDRSYIEVPQAWGAHWVRVLRASIHRQHSPATFTGNVQRRRWAAGCRCNVAMAEEGADFRKILSHYYPNTTVVTSR